MKRIFLAILLLFCLVPSSKAQYGFLADRITDMLTPALSGSFNYKGYVDVAYLAGLGDYNERTDILEISTSQGFNYASWCFMGVGAGVNILFPQPAKVSYNQDVAVMVPFFTDFRFNIGQANRVGLVIDLKVGGSLLVTDEDFYIGWSCMSNSLSFYLKPSIGLRIPINKKTGKQALSVTASYQLTTPKFVSGYNFCLNNLGATVAFEW